MLIKLSNRKIDSPLRKGVVPYFLYNDFKIVSLSNPTFSGNIKVSVTRNEDDNDAGGKYKKAWYYVDFWVNPGKLQSGEPSKFLQLYIVDFITDRNALNCVHINNSFDKLKGFAEATKSVYDSTITIGKCESYKEDEMLIGCNLATIAYTAISLDIERSKLAGAKDIDKKLTIDTISTLENQLALLCSNPPLLTISSVYTINSDGIPKKFVYGNTLENFGVDSISIIDDVNASVGLPDVRIRPKTSIMDVLISNRFKLVREIRNMLKYAVVPSEMELSDLSVLETNYREFLFSQKEKQKLVYRPVIQAPSVGSVLLSYIKTKPTEANGLKIIASMLFDSDTNGFSSDHDSRADDITLPNITQVTTFSPKNNYKDIGDNITVDDMAKSMIREFLVFVAMIINSIDMVGESGIHKDEITFSAFYLLNVFQRGFILGDDSLITQPSSFRDSVEVIDITVPANIVGL